MDTEAFAYLTLPDSGKTVTVSADDVREVVFELAGSLGRYADEWYDFRVWVRLARALGMTPKDFD